MMEPTEIPDAVIKSFNNWKIRNRLCRHTDEIPKLCFDEHLMGCYYFWYHGSFFGIELDGYLHT